MSRSKAKGAKPPVAARVADWFDDRLGTSKFVRSALNKVFPDNWSFMLGEIAFYCFIVLVLTGVYLTFFFVPSGREVVYHGSYVPLRGQTMSEAYESTVRLSFDVRAGLVFRQMHHWAALLFAGAVVLHLCRIFFTSAFRRPRELNWIVGLILLLLVMFNGFTGYSLPDDLLSGTGLRILYSVALAVPVLGTWLAFLLFGGEFPSPSITSRLFVIHVLLVPAIIAGLLTVHLAMVWRQKHTQFRGPGRTETNIVGSRLWPTYAARSMGLLAAVFAVCAFLGGLVQINPIWLYGPFDPASVTTASQPDWYMGWLEGALRLGPAWRFHVFGYPISELFWPGVVFPTILFGLLFLWPFLEKRITGDREAHHLLDRPRDRPVHTALGVATLSFLLVLFVAGSQDIVAQKLGLSIPSVTLGLRLTAVGLPILAGLLAWKVCHDLIGAEALAHRKAEIVGEAPGPDQLRPLEPADALAAHEAARAAAAGTAPMPAAPRSRRRGALALGALMVVGGVAAGVAAGRRLGRTIYLLPRGPDDKGR